MALIFGFLTGLALVVPVGPIALAIIGIGATAGRRPALRAAGGVALADVALIVAAFAGGGALLAVPDHVLAVVRLTLGVALVAIGVLLIARASAALSATEHVRHPMATLFVGTIGNPLTLALWLGVATAAPYADDLDSRVAFLAGLVIATITWHTLLALGGSALEGRLSPHGMKVAARIGGVVVAAVGVAGLVAGV